MAHYHNCICLLISLLFCVSFLQSGVIGQWAIDDEGCITPDRNTGDCIPIRQCKILIDYLTNSPKPLSEKVREKLRSYTCSLDANTVKVCCPRTPIKIDDEDSGDSSSSESSDLSKHKNFGLLPSDCGYLPLDDKIINGEDAGLNNFPWMALLSYRTAQGAKFKCGGTIVNDKWILTAAHCVSDLEDPLLGVRVGEYNILNKVDCEIQEDGSNKCAPPIQDLFIEKVIAHPGFNKSVIRDDIALVKVSKMNLKTENVRPVCLPIDNARTQQFVHGVVTGWGVTESGRTSDILQKVALPIVPREKCQSIYQQNTRVRITHKQLCAGGKNKKDSCPGDSGGPLQVASYLNDETRFVQQGIVSFGPRECGLEGYPGVYTRVAYYLEWILDTLTP